jgi:hypothetical protein
MGIVIRLPTYGGMYTCTTTLQLVAMKKFNVGKAEKVTLVRVAGKKGGER